MSHHQNLDDRLHRNHNRLIVESWTEWDRVGMLGEIGLTSQIPCFSPTTTQWSGNAWSSS